MSYPDIKTFLSSCRLDEYTPKFLEMGFDDVDFLINYISSSSQQMQALVKQTNLKPGHIMKLNAAIHRYHQQFPGKLIHADPPIRPEEDDSSGISSVSVRSATTLSAPISAGSGLRQPSRRTLAGPAVTAETQLEGHMEDLERSLTRLMDSDGDDSSSDIGPRPSSILSVASTTSVSSAPLSPVSSQSPSLDPSSTPRSGTPEVTILPPPVSLPPPVITKKTVVKKVAPATPKVAKTVPPKSAPESKPPETFEVVTTKSSKRQLKKAAKANLQALENCAEGYFCTERLNCKLCHTKDEKLFFRNPIAKTKACTRNLGGICDKHADNCGYAHSSKDARCLRCRQRGHFVGQCTQTKTRPCRRKNGSVCDRDPMMCGFAHSKQDARCLSCEARGHFVEQCPEKIT